MAAVALLLAVGLAGCDGGDTGDPAASPSTPVASPTASESPESTPTPDPVDIPDDCQGMLSDEVLAQLEDVPLNDPAVGPTGVLEDGSLLCVWRHPSADTTALSTTIAHVDRGPALDMLNDLVEEDDFTCYTPDEGTRCEKTWENKTFPVTDGRTLYWRDGVLIDTTYSNLAPEGYTDSIIAHLFD